MNSPSAFYPSYSYRNVREFDNTSLGYPEIYYHVPVYVYRNVYEFDNTSMNGTMKRTSSTEGDCQTTHVGRELTKKAADYCKQDNIKIAVGDNDSVPLEYEESASDNQPPPTEDDWRSSPIGQELIKKAIEYCKWAGIKIVDSSCPQLCNDEIPPQESKESSGGETSEIEYEKPMHPLVLTKGNPVVYPVDLFESLLYSGKGVELKRRHPSIREEYEACTTNASEQDLD